MVKFNIEKEKGRKGERKSVITASSVSSVSVSLSLCVLWSANGLLIELLLLELFLSPVCTLRLPGLCFTLKTFPSPSTQAHLASSCSLAHSIVRSFVLLCLRWRRPRAPFKINFWKPALKESWWLSSDCDQQQQQQQLVVDGSDLVVLVVLQCCLFYYRPIRAEFLKWRERERERMRKSRFLNSKLKPKLLSLEFCVSFSAI